jgi:16S rRNA (guanine1516-N2)-methyltransferase
MFEIKFWGNSASKKADFWSALPKEIHLQEIDQKPSSGFYLFYDQDKLSLGFSLEELDGFKPLSFDWEDSLYSLKKTMKSYKQESLYKALALAKNKEALVADASLGTGKDSLVMKIMGAQVHSYERNPWVYLLALDAYHRLSSKNGLTLHFGSIDKPYPFIYFDPMFPEKKKSALPPKEMQIFKSLVGEDLDQATEAARLLGCTEKRLLVKRPNWADPILPNPHMNYETKLMRIDAYVVS